MIDISFIVPIYNVEQYLRKCVDSLLAQDYENYEIILVDDGSPDACPTICDEYVAAHNNIRVLHLENAGLSAARNCGMKIAQGEYICFVDSDDYWEQNKLMEAMHHVQQDNLDVLRFDYQNVRQSTAGQYEVFEPNKYPHIFDTQTDVVDGETYLNERMGYACYVTQFIFRKSIIPPFVPNIHFEDTEWLPRVMLQANRVNSAPVVVYNYLIRQGSITQAKGNTDKMRKNIEDYMFIIEQYNAFRKQYPGCRWLRNMQSNMTVSVLANVAQFIYPDRKAYLNRLRALQVFPLSIADQGRTYIKKAKLINLSPCLAVKIIHYKNILRI